MHTVMMFFIGIAAGLLSGMFGVGGGVIIVPALVLMLGMNQHSATATSLVALLLPVGILGVLEYYRAGKISVDNIWIGLVIAAGLFAGAFFGAKIAGSLSGDILRKAFAVFIGIVALRLWFK
ncbi:sulfite exporter TauE/SafE family protein [Chlorobium sp.]|uniref:sulfite exporter TauE/SafE family protein n=1 Tax=Chlorobium sp. TaxID=1095 RepID=UPI002F40B0C6